MSRTFDALDNNWTGNENIALGSEAASNLTAGDNNIDIGNKGVAEESNTIRIGSAETHTATYIAGISGATVASGVGVVINNQGQLGTVVSSARFKEAIRRMDKASEAILALQPVTFRYKHELDPAGIPQFGGLFPSHAVAKILGREHPATGGTTKGEMLRFMMIGVRILREQQIDYLPPTLFDGNLRRWLGRRSLHCQ